MERMQSVGWEGAVGRHRPEQIAQISTWGVVPDDQLRAASMITIGIVPKNGSTETTVNPLDPGDESTTSWYDCPASDGTLFPAGRMT